MPFAIALRPDAIPLRAFAIGAGQIANATHPDTTGTLALAWATLADAPAHKEFAIGRGGFASAPERS
ncbi:MAG TPA: hypothetical protein VGR35_23090 [Tepidisphaeraceae bacterium]|nr:hypothetical protein [Tepidisphaeraceae bacterium]